MELEIRRRIALCNTPFAFCSSPLQFVTLKNTGKGENVDSNKPSIKYNNNNRNHCFMAKIIKEGTHHDINDFMSKKEEEEGKKRLLEYLLKNYLPKDIEYDKSTFSIRNSLGALEITIKTKYYKEFEYLANKALQDQKDKLMSKLYEEIKGLKNDLEKERELAKKKEARPIEELIKKHNMEAYRKITYINLNDLNAAKFLNDEEKRKVLGLLPNEEDIEVSMSNTRMDKIDSKKPAICDVEKERKVTIEEIQKVRQNLYFWQHNADTDTPETNFMAYIFMLFSKADKYNIEKLKRGFPLELEVYKEWYFSDNPRDLFESWGVTTLNNN